VRVEDVQREEVGAKLTIIGESRVSVQDINESELYITGVFTPVPVMGAGGTLAYTPSDDEMAEVEALTEFINTAVSDIVTLVDRLLADQQGGLSWDTRDAAAEVEWGHAEVGNLRRAMAWIQSPSVTLDRMTPPVSMDTADWVGESALQLVDHSQLQLAERLSFACLQVAPASTESDLQKLISCRAVAMSTSHGLMDRLKLGQIVLDEQRQALRAKVALKSAFGGGGGGGSEGTEGGTDDGDGGAVGGGPD